MKSFEILEKVLSKIKLSDKELENMNRGISEFVDKLKNKIKQTKTSAEVFVGGSSGKETAVKRKKQDIDIFVRFIGKDKEISNLLEKILRKIKNIKVKKIHGSRDYFKVRFKSLEFEVVPVLRIGKPQEAENVTDLSYFHVSYVRNAFGISDHPKKAKLFSDVKKKMREKDLRDDVRLAKNFCFAQGVYGAESYIKGFSGYSLELLVIYYKGFENMIKALSKVDVSRKKIIIDLEKHYKGKKVEEEMNESKLSSPVVFVDPTFKERNVLAGLSYESFFRFQDACRKFLKKPDEKFFFPQPINKKNFNLILTAKTNRQEGDIAGSKLFKFYNIVYRDLEKYFLISSSEFEYEGKKADYYFKIKPRKILILEGPPINAVENVVKFKKKHKNVFIKNRKVYAKEKPVKIRRFLADFKKKNKNVMKDMGIVGVS